MMIRPVALALLLTLAACGSQPEVGLEPEANHGDDGVVTLTPQQIAASGIEIARPMIGGRAGTIELPATIEGDPQATRIVSAAIGGRVIKLNANLGETVTRGRTLAVIESREAAELNGAVETSRARLALAESNLARERRLFAERVSPEQDLIAARTAAVEARIAHAQARQQVAAAGAGGGTSNRIAITAPLSGQIIARPVTLGQTVTADAELYRVANLSAVSLSIALQPAEAARVKPGAAVLVTAAGRQGRARIAFVSPALDLATRLVPAIAQLDNRAGQWRIGEPVTAAIDLPGGRDSTVRVPSTAVQTLEGRTVVFARTTTGFRAVPVTLGRQDGDSIVVLRGLAGRERIAAANSFILKSTLGATEAGHHD